MLVFKQVHRGVDVGHMNEVGSVKRDTVHQSDGSVSLIQSKDKHMHLTGIVDPGHFFQPAIH